MLKFTAKIAMAGYLMVALAGLSGCASMKPAEPEPRHPSSYAEESPVRPAPWDHFYRYNTGKLEFY